MPKFQPGQSGNPKGRPPMDPVMRELAQAAGPKAISMLINVMNGLDFEGNRKVDYEPEVRIKAIQQILDRAYGKPPQAVLLDPRAGAPLLSAVVHRPVYVESKVIDKPATDRK